MNGDMYMNRIALAVKSALGLAILVPPSLALAANTPASDTALDEIVVTGIRQSVELSIREQAQCSGHHRSRYAGRYRQDAG